MLGTVSIEESELLSMLPSPHHHFIPVFSLYYNHVFTGSTRVHLREDQNLTFLLTIIHIGMLIQACRTKITTMVRQCPKRRNKNTVHIKTRTTRARHQISSFTLFIQFLYD